MWHSRQIKYVRRYAVNIIFMLNFAAYFDEKEVTLNFTVIVINYVLHYIFSFLFSLFPSWHFDLIFLSRHLIMVSPAKTVIILRDVAFNGGGTDGYMEQHADKLQLTALQNSAR